MLERASYYGLRAFLIIYMTGEILNMETMKASSIYSWFIGSVVFSQIFGALLGDLLIGNKKAILTGGIIQALGAFSLCIPNTICLYTGLFLLVLGNGLFTPNLTANFGKSYLNKTKLLEAGFTIFYLTINLGSFLGVIVIGYFVEQCGYKIGFLTCGILSLLSLIPILKSKENEFQDLEKISIGKRVSNIFIPFIVVLLFWGFHELSSIRTSNLQFQLNEVSNFDIPNLIWQSLKSILIFLFSIIAIIFWTYFYSSQFFKLLLGVIFGILSFGILFLIPEVPSEQHTITYLISVIFLAISEIYIAPIIHTVLTKYSNPKYLAILISLAFLPTQGITLALGLFNDKLIDYPMLGLKIGIIGMGIIGIGLIGYIIINKKRTSNNFNK